MREPDGVKKTALEILCGVHYLECTRHLNGDIDYFKYSLNVNVSIGLLYINRYAENSLLLRCK